MAVTAEQVEAGHRLYTKPVLALYDLFVAGFSNRVVWKCPTRSILSLYNRCITGNHLEVGPGTGFYLDRCEFPQPVQRIVLADLNPHCLEWASRRIARYHPSTIQANALKPLEIKNPGFDSVGINYVLHCLPGTMQTKGEVFANLKAVLNPDGVLFGSTVLSEGVPRGRLAKTFMEIYNSRGVFSNTGDDLDGLRSQLSKYFSRYGVETAGCVALFWGSE